MIKIRSLQPYFVPLPFSTLVGNQWSRIGGKGSKQSVHSFPAFRSTSLHFISVIRSHTVCIELESSQGGPCVSSQESNASTGRRTPLRDRFAYPSLRASASFRKRALVVGVMAEKAAELNLKETLVHREEA